MARKPHMIANWKMNGRMPQAITLCHEILNGVEKLEQDQFVSVICPPAPLLVPVTAVVRTSGIYTGGQDCHHEAEGAFTGDYSAGMIRDCGAEYIILGHSERRQYHQETTDMIWQKARLAWQEKLKVVYCVGETAQEHKDGMTLSVIEKQMTPFYDEACQIDKLIIAYEPVWAIGTGLTATPQDANNVHAFIRAGLEDAFGTRAANQTIILYGGSMKPNNALELMQEEHIDGGLIGGASLNAKDFLAIIEACIPS